MADLPESDYGSQKYWENLYATRYANKTFDWYQVRRRLVSISMRGFLTLTRGLRGTVAAHLPASVAREGDPRDWLRQLDVVVKGQPAPI